MDTLNMKIVRVSRCAKNVGSLVDTEPRSKGLTDSPRASIFALSISTYRNARPNSFIRAWPSPPSFYCATILFVEKIPLNKNTGGMIFRL